MIQKDKTATENAEIDLTEIQEKNRKQTKNSNN